MITNYEWTDEEVRRINEMSAKFDLLKRTQRQHNYILQKNHGITPAQYEYQFKKQGGVCAICGEPPTKKRLAVDKHKASGKPRGLLCTRCHVGIGYFRDNIETLKTAIVYLENFEKILALQAAEIDT